MRAVRAGHFGAPPLRNFGNFGDTAPQDSTLTQDDQTLADVQALLADPTYQPTNTLPATQSDQGPLAQPGQTPMSPLLWILALAGAYLLWQSMSEETSQGEKQEKQNPYKPGVGMMTSEDVDELLSMSHDELRAMPTGELQVILTRAKISDENAVEEKIWKELNFRDTNLEYINKHGRRNPRRRKAKRKKGKRSSRLGEV